MPTMKSFAAPMEKRDEALVKLGRSLRDAGYGFITPTPETHRRVNRRPGNEFARNVTDIFGWSRPFQEGALPQTMVTLLEEANALEFTDGALRSAVRFSTLGNQLFVHSAFPTDGQDAVFFGPDTYRFSRCIADLARTMPTFAPRFVADIGCGSGAGGLFAQTMFPSASRIILADINSRALRFARVNAAINEVGGIEARYCDVMRDIPEEVDLIVSNPPYLVDRLVRAYRHGGGDWGYALSLRILGEALSHLTADGMALIYTGAAVARGTDLFLKAVTALLRDCPFHYEEVDPDVFGEELEHSPYDAADRIAAVSLVVRAADLKRCRRHDA